jgi:hypothetical protein
MAYNGERVAASFSFSLSTPSNSSTIPPPTAMATVLQKYGSGPVSPPAIHEEEKGVESSTSAGSSSSSPSNAATSACLPEYVEATMPPGVAIRPNSFGLGLFATQPFQAGDTLYITSCLYVPDIVPGKVTLRLTGSGKEYALDMQEHSVVQSDLPGKRQLYTYDAFMNHACDPNTTSFVTGSTSEELTCGMGSTSEELTYGMKALSAISVGEELTCDYNLFEFEAGDAAILRCQCGARECLGAIKGFRYLSFEEALARFATAEPYVIASYLEEHPEVCFVDLSKRNKGKEGSEEGEEGEQQQQSRRKEAGEEGEEVGMEVTFEEGGGCKAVAARAWVSGEVLFQGIQVPQYKQQHQHQHQEVEKQQAFIVVLGPDVARGSASIDLTGLRREAEVLEEGRGGGEEEEEDTWPLRFLFGGGGRRKGGEKKANVRVEREGGREGEEEEGRTYRVVATAAIGVGQTLLVEGGRGGEGSV